MIRTLVALALAGLTASPSFAQVTPRADRDNPRLQVVEWIAGQEVILTSFPDVGLTVFLDQEERIQRIGADSDAPITVRVSPEGNSFLVVPEAALSGTSMTVDTDKRSYALILRTSNNLDAGLVVRFAYRDERTSASEADTMPKEGTLWTYRLRGDDKVKPALIRDDGSRTFIQYAPDQALPAVFAIGPTGDEEVVNGHMRGGLFVIDRVHQELVFRIDKEKATARRNREQDGAG